MLVLTSRANLGSRNFADVRSIVEMTLQEGKDRPPAPDSPPPSDPPRTR